jgi:hypothetical protein
MLATPPFWKRLFALAADAAFVLLLAAALVIQSRGGVRWRIGGVAVTAGSGARAFLLAVIILLVRHAVTRRPSIGDRAGAVLRWLQRLGRYARRCLDRLRPAGALALALDWPSKREWLWITFAMGIATAVILRQQVVALTSVPDFGDPLFSMWRLGWVAHQLPRDPSRLFDANIYFPAARTLAYSDAMLGPGVVAAPALWLGVPTLIVYNTLFLGSFVAAGLAMFALARAVTGHAGAATVAAFVFAFDPYRYSHYSHLELQFSCWMPLALLAMFRTLSTGRLRHGIATGVLVSLQALSSLYYGAYLSVSLVAVAAGWICVVGWPVRRAWGSLTAGVLIASTTGALITIPYRANRATVGERHEDEIRNYSAEPRHYLTSSRRSALYGAALYPREHGELELFPGTVSAVIAAAALIPPLNPLVLPAAVGLIASVDASFGLRGALYTWLDKLAPFRGFRVAARFRAVAGLYLALLAGMGISRLARFIPTVWPRRLAVSAIAVAVLVDVHPTLELRPLWTHGPDVYARVPDGGVLADLPMFENADPVFTYLSTFHWHPIVNGASGFEPPWYASLVSISREFPADAALDAFSKLGTEYIVLHAAYYRNDFPRVVAAAEAQPRLQFVAATTWEEGDCRLYRLLR